MNVLAFGYDTSYIGTTLALKSFQRDFGLDKMSDTEQDDVTGNLTSIYSVGGFFGALLMFYSLEFLGRKMTVLISDSFFILGAILSTAAGGHLGLMYAGRLICGFGMGGAIAVTPTYISELSPPAIRGRMTGLFESVYQVGSLVGFWINFGITRHIDTNSSIAWRIPMGVQLIPAGLVALGIPFLRESPTWLLKKGREEEAIKVYSFLRMLPESHTYVLEDVANVKAQLELERAICITPDVEGSGNIKVSFWRFLRTAVKEAMSKGVRNRFALVAMVCLLQPWCGAVAINYYSPTIFESIGLDNVTLWTGIYGIIKSISAIIFFSVLIDLTGRKWPWIVSCVCCAICMYYLAAYVKIEHPTVGVQMSASGEAASKGATAAIMLFGFAWSFGANGLPLIIASEVFPSSLRSVGGNFASMCVWLWSFVVTKSVPSMFRAMGWGIYVFFGSILVSAALYGFFFIPETKGLRIDQMDMLFGGIAGQVVDYEKELKVEHAEMSPDSKAIE